MTAIAPTAPPLSVAVADAGLGIKAELLLVAVTVKICPLSPTPSLIPERLIGVSATADPVPFSVSVRGVGDRVERGRLVDLQDIHGDGHGDRIDVAVAARAAVHQGEVDRGRPAIVGCEREGEEARAVDARDAIVGGRDVRDQLHRGVRDVGAVGDRGGEGQGICVLASPSLMPVRKRVTGPPFSRTVTG